MTDGELLSQFLFDARSSAFEALLKRHGPMVMGVCRRILRNEADAEDAFQTTFLVLVRKAATIRPRRMVGNWLYGVAQTTALKARAMRSKRSAKERLAVAKEISQPSSAEELSHLQILLDEELQSLSARYRTVIVMCELEGRSTKEAAQELDCPIGTVTSRLARGRRLLAERMTKRGLKLSAAAFATSLARCGSASDVPQSLMSATLQTGLHVAAQGVKASLIGSSVTALTEDVLKAMLISKLKVMGVIMSFAAVTIALGGILAQAASIEQEKSKLQGEWQAVEVEVQGKKLKKDDREVKDMRFVFQGNDLVIGPPPGTGAVGRGGETPGQRKKTFVLAPGKTPKQIDMTSQDGKEKDQVSRGIYKLEKDRLTVCFPAKAETDRPKEFKAGAEDGMMMIVLDRVKK